MPLSRFVRPLRSPQRRFGWLSSLKSNVFLGIRQRRLKQERTGEGAAAWVEILEDRTLLAASPAASGGEIVFIDSSVTDYQALSGSVGETAEVVVLDSANDAILQIRDVLTGYSGLSAIHILSHGSTGQLTFGSGNLSNANLPTYSEALAEIGATLAEDGDLLLYGCYVGADAAGRDFVNALAEVTGADVAASDDLTGSATLIGDWQFETTTGRIGDSQIDEILAASSFEGVLGTIDFSDSSTSTSVTSTDSGVTVTVTIDENTVTGGDKNIDIAAGGGFAGTSGNFLLFNSDQIASSTTLLFSFDQEVSITSFRFVEVSNRDTGNYVFTPDSGSTISFAAADLAANTGTTVNSASGLGTLSQISTWTNVNSFSYTYTGGTANSSPGFDTIVFSDPPANDSDGNLTAAAGVTEPVGLDTTVDTPGEAVDVFDFTLTDGGSGDGLAMTVSQVVVNVSGTSTDAERGNVTWRLNGPDTSNVTGVYNGGADTITFSGLSISVADGISEVYTVNAYYNDNTNLTEDHTFVLSVDGDTDLTINSAGTQMGVTSAVTNGSGSTVDVTATALAFTTQPAGSVSGQALTTQPVVTAQDAFGNTDVDFTETVTLTEASAGSITNNAAAAASGVATFVALVYTASVDQESFTLTANDQDGIGSDLPTVDANAVTSDVVATKLLFVTQPVPLTVQNGMAEDFTTDSVVRAVDVNNTTDTGYSTDITLAEVNGAGSATMSGTGDTDGNGSTVSLTPSSGVATFTNLQLTYTNNGGGDETFNLRASSGGLTTADSSQLTSDANIAPAFAGLDGTPAFTEGGSVVTLDANVTVSDTELDALNGANGDYAGASLTIARNGGANAEDSFAFDTSGALFTVSGGNLQDGGQTFATFTNAAGTLTVSFTSSGTTATQALVNDVLQHIQYGNTGDDPPTTPQLDWTFNDGNAGSDTGSTTVSITGVNDEPTLTATGNDPIFSSGGAAVDLFNTVTASTVEMGQTFTSMTLTVTNVTNGMYEVLEFDGSNVQLTDGFNVASTANNSLDVSVSVSGSTATVSFSGATLSEAALATLIDDLTYSNDREIPATADDRVVTITTLVDSGSNVGANDNTASLANTSSVSVVIGCSTNPSAAQGPISVGPGFNNATGVFIPFPSGLSFSRDFYLNADMVVVDINRTKAGGDPGDSIQMFWASSAADVAANLFLSTNTSANSANLLRNNIADEAPAGAIKGVVVKTAGAATWTATLFNIFMVGDGNDSAGGGGDPAVVTDGNIAISGATGTGGAFKVGDTVTVTWDNTASGDNNTGVVAATVDFSDFGGGDSVTATNNSETWTATYTITEDGGGSIDATNLHVSVSAATCGGSDTTEHTTAVTLDNDSPVVTDGFISLNTGSGDGGAFRAGDTVTATWNNTGAGDNNSDTIAGVTVDFSDFGGGAAVSAGNNGGTWTASFKLTGSVAAAMNRNVSVTATDNAGNTTTTADTSNASTLLSFLREVNLSLNIATSVEENQADIIVTATTDGPVSGNQTMAIDVSGIGITAEDGTLSSMSIVINDGQSTGTAIYKIHDDLLVEGVETAVFTISTPSSGLALGSTTTRSVMISDNDTATVEFLTDSSSTTDESAGVFPVTVVLTLSPGTTLASDVTVNVASADDTATAGIDYTAVNETLTFLAGSGSDTRTIELPILENVETEADETLTLTLSSPVAPLALGPQTMHTLTITADAYDFGDAPTAAQSGFANSYPTLLADGAAFHNLAGPRLGATIDIETDGQPGLNANGDGADENGVAFLNTGNVLYVSSTDSLQAEVQIDLQNADATANRLDAWIDFNRDGDWNDAGEQIFTNFDLGTTNGTQTLTFTLPAGASVGNSYARFRLSTAGSLSPTGAVSDGEVEDYQVELTAEPDVVLPNDNVLHRRVETYAGNEQRFLLGVPQTHGPVNLSFLVTPTNGSGFDPAAVQVFDAAGNAISASFSSADINDGQASLVVAGVSVGQFTVIISGTGTGGYMLEALLAGAFDGNANAGTGSVNQDSQQAATANSITLLGSNSISTQLFDLLAVSLTEDQYVPEFDANLDNQLDNTDLAAITGNLGFTQITFDRLTSPLPVGAGPVGNSAPELAAIADQTASFNGGQVTIDLSATDANGDLLAFSATLQGEDPNVALARQLDQTLGLTFTGNMHRNWGGANERWLLSDSGEWYFITPDGRVRQWTGAEPGENFLPNSVHVATLTAAYHTNLPLLYDAPQDVEPIELQGSSAQVNGDQMTVTLGTGFVGELSVQAIVSDGYALDSQWFKVATTDALPELDLPDQTLSVSAENLVVDLPAQDADGETITYAVELTAVDLLAAQAYELDQQLNLYAVANEFLNWGGAGERWMQGDSEFWYFITPAGQFYRWNGSQSDAGFISGSTLLATLDGSYHTNLAAVYDAQPPVAGDLQGSTAIVTDHQLVVTPGDGFVDALNVTVTASDARNEVTDSFLLSIVNQPPVLNLPDVTRTTDDDPLSITLPAEDADGETVNYSVSLTAVDSLELRAYELDQELELRLAGTDFLNWGGAGERWVRAASTDWYFITPDGQFYRWNGSLSGAGFVAGSTLVATLDASFHTDLSKLYSAPQPTAGDVQGSTAVITGGNQLAVNPGSGFIGKLRVRVEARDSLHTTIDEFTVTVNDAGQAMLNAFFTNWDGLLE